MFVDWSQYNLTAITDIVSVSDDVVLISTIDGRIRLTSINPEIQYILSVIGMTDTEIYLTTKHYDREEHFIDIVEIRKEK